MPKKANNTQNGQSQTRIVQALFTLRSSISHQGTAQGTTGVFNRIKVVTRHGDVEEVPLVTGNSFRGQLRDHAAKHLIETAGLKPEDLRQAGAALLFSGGSLTKVSSSGVSLEQVRTLTDALPPLALFGGSFGNHIVRGKLISGMFIPVADETALYLPPDLREAAMKASVFDLIQIESYTRRDDSRDERFTRYYPEVQPKAEDAASTQMRYELETLVAGTQLYWHFVLQDVTYLEEQVFLAAMRSWAEHPTLGGRVAVGHGLVEADMDNGWRITPYGHNLPSAADYEDYLVRNASWIREVLASV